MKHIDGFYTDKKNRIIDFSCDIASSWEELKPYQTAFILQALTFRRSNKYMLGVALLSALFDGRWKILSNLGDDELNQLMPLTNFLIDSEPELKNPFPTLNLRRKQYLAPADDLSNIGFGEWVFAFQSYQNYCDKKDKIYLDELIAALYRLRDPQQNESNPEYKGDNRLPFNENLIAPVARTVADIDEHRKLAILSWFAAAVLNIMNTRPNLFPVKNDQQPDQDGGDDAGRTWFSVFRELLGPKWGTIDQLKYTNAMFVLDGLEEQQLEHNSQPS
jgi:hypothetical protein